MYKRQRIDSLLQLAEVQSELRAEPGHHSQHPDTGLPTRQYVDRQATQAVSHAMRHEGPVSVMVMAFDRLEALSQEHGGALGKELKKRIAGITAHKVRKEERSGLYYSKETAVV